MTADSRRLSPPIRDFCQPPQSGFVRTVEDPFLLLYELIAETMDLHRALWLLMGDCVEAFPRQWRAALLDGVERGPRIRGGALVAFGDILQQDVVCVWLSGCSEVHVTQGILRVAVSAPCSIQ